MNLKFTSLIFVSLTFFTIHTVLGQDQEIAGIINTYTNVLQIDNCQNAVIVNDASTFQVEDFIVIHQAKGAMIENRPGRNDFGNVLEMNNTGRYEKNQIRAINGDTLLLRNIILHEYEIEGMVQVVSMPVYENATVIDTIFPAPWDGQTGGIVAFAVQNTLTLQAPIVASNLGFAGGRVSSPSNDCTGGLNNGQLFFYNDGNWRGAPKGEGIAAFIPNKENGRGPQANGGGGGNDHNSGGGGGANLTNGGNGGRRETMLFSLSCRGDNPGLRGIGVERSEDRIHFGGGGGAGHTNNSIVKTSGNGGGIILLEAPTIVGNGQAIESDGGSGSIIEGDGASGGGGGGTIVLISNSVAGDLTLQVLGGDGGDADNNQQDDCFGPGGGGSGGHIVTSLQGGFAVALNFEGGSAGRSRFSTRSNCNNTNNGASNGGLGVISAIENIPTGELLALPRIINQPLTLSGCPTQNLDILVETNREDFMYQWQIDRGNGNGFEDLVEGINYQNVNTNQLTIINLNVNMEGHQFRLIATTECLGEIASLAIPLSLDEVTFPSADFDFVVEEQGVVIFNNTSRFGDQFTWAFGDGVQSEQRNTSHTYTEEGEYEVVLTVANRCGEVSITKTVNVVFVPVAGFDFAIGAGNCAPLEVTFENQSLNTIENFEWIFEGGTPETSSEANPVVVYNDGGTFDVTLIVSNAVGSDTLIDIGIVDIRAAPDVNFIAENEDGSLTVKLTNTTVNGDQYVWNFGDGSATNDTPNPTHTFERPGNYVITLTSVNDCGSNMIMKEVAVGSSPFALFSSDKSVGCDPLTVQFIDQSDGFINSWEWTFEGGQPATSTERNPVVIYNEVGEYDVTLNVTNELGTDSNVKVGFVRIGNAPDPDFSFDVEEGLVNFTNESDSLNSFVWVFGDGEISEAIDPTHEFKNGGVYYVTLNAYNEFCGASVTKAINIYLTSTEELADGTIINTFPNPTQDLLNVEFQNPSIQTISYRLLDISGRTVQAGQWNTNVIQQLNLPEATAGLYLLQLFGTDWQVVQRVVKE